MGNGAEVTFEIGRRDRPRRERGLIATLVGAAFYTAGSEDETEWYVAAKARGVELCRYDAATQDVARERGAMLRRELDDDGLEHWLDRHAVPDARRRAAGLT